MGTKDEITYGGSGSSGTQNGLDHLFSRIDENGDEILIVVESKQFKPGKGVELGRSNAGTQLGNRWLGDVSDRIPNSNTKDKLQDALMEGRVETYVAAANKQMGEFF